MAKEFSEVLAGLSEKDQDILACAQVLGVHPLSIMKVEWGEREGRPQPYVTVILGNAIKGQWRSGRFPWTAENLPIEKTKKVQEFLNEIERRKRWSKHYS